ncbi:MAG: hypothetical protein BWX70_03100 [Verrucomicrobia bacterium ADurb.Bin070]|nr:MAG: hypothetical protein BWX70_03100 [Verrucomicrobia bacterium ADurb.Bin070]
MSASSPFMMFSIASFGLAASVRALARPSASVTSRSEATSGMISRRVLRATSSCASRSNGSPKTTVSRWPSFMSGTALSRVQS